MRRAGVFATILAFAASCGGNPTAPETAHVTLGGDTVARVGSVTIPVSMVAQVAAASSVAPRVAVERLIDDALAAESARAGSGEQSIRAHWASEAILARVAVDRIAEAARASGPPTDAELVEATDAHFRELALPEQVKVIHAIVVRPKDPADAGRARALAVQLAQSVSGAKTEDDFEARAKAIPTSGLEIIVQRLDAFIADGRTSEGERAVMAAPFASAAFALAKPGETSGVVETSFGWHVIRLLERRPPHIVPLEERRAILAPEVLVHRSADALEALFTAAHARVKIEIQPDAFALMSSVSFEAPP